MDDLLIGCFIAILRLVTWTQLLSPAVGLPWPFDCRLELANAVFLMTLNAKVTISNNFSHMLVFESLVLSLRDEDQPVILVGDGWKGGRDVSCREGRDARASRAWHCSAIGAGPRDKGRAGLGWAGSVLRGRVVLVFY